MDILIPFTKVWKYKTGDYGEMPYHLNPNSMSIEGVELCKIYNGKVTVDCTKLYYPGRFIMILGTPEEFLQKCREANIAYGLLSDLYKEGITIKQFMQQNESLNNVQF